MGPLETNIKLKDD